MIKTAVRKLFWHGTSSKYLRRILKMGLDPGSKEKQYTSAPDDRSGRSIETYGGIYLTDNWMTALTHANNAARKSGGYPMMIAVSYDTRTPRTLIDEDDLVNLLSEAAGDLNYGNDLFSPRSGWAPYLFHSGDMWLPGQFRPEKIPWIIEIIQKADISHIVMKFLELFIDKYPQIHKRYLSQSPKIRFLVEQMLRADAMDAFRRNFQSNQKALKKTYQDFLRSDTSHITPSKLEEMKSKYYRGLSLLDNPPGELYGTFDRLKKAVYEFSAAVPEASEGSERSLRHNVRVQDLISFHGKNRILLIAIHKRIINPETKKEYKEIFIPFSLNALFTDKHINLYSQYWGGSFRVIDKSGNEIFRNS